MPIAMPWELFRRDSQHIPRYKPNDSDQVRHESTERTVLSVVNVQVFNSYVDLAYLCRAKYDCEDRSFFGSWAM